MSSSLHPIVKWAQRKDKIFITLGLRDIEDEKVDLKEGRIAFSGTSAKNTYEFAVQFYADINIEKSKWSKTGFNMVFALEKKEQSSTYWPRLTKEKLKSQFIQIDWDKWIDEDEEQAQGAKGLGDMDYEGMNNFNDEDEESEEGIRADNFENNAQDSEKKHDNHHNHHGGCC